MQLLGAGTRYPSLLSSKFRTKRTVRSRVGPDHSGHWHSKSPAQGEGAPGGGGEGTKGPPAASSLYADENRCVGTRPICHGTHASLISPPPPARPSSLPNTAFFRKKTLSLYEWVFLVTILSVILLPRACSLTCGSECLLPAETKGDGRADLVWTLGRRDISETRPQEAGGAGDGQGLMTAQLCALF